MVFRCSDILVIGGQGPILPYKSERNDEKNHKCKIDVNLGIKFSNRIPNNSIFEGNIIHWPATEEESHG